MKTFNIYFSHEVAKKDGCFNCHTDCSEQPHKKSGYPTGKYKVVCPKCGFTKFYDVEEKT